ncbi:hypothetical protein Y032_0546g3265 [Ancylostoma ceylanicum]|uniref:Uncharacterized protein n=1 Tax=Ancylostoma ceylanicum TaxID=53326 RepID=A0A016WST4_9BILA|nr:hypothetical protein Y032_0546g3265 [Ancylostoma ceylanicum]
MDLLARVYATQLLLQGECPVHTLDFTPEFEVVVLYRRLGNILHRKIMEAQEIKRFQPEINNMEELVEALRLIA